LGSETFAFKDEDGHTVYFIDLEDELVAAVLSGCRKGMKAVKVRFSAALEHLHGYLLRATFLHWRIWSFLEVYIFMAMV